MPQDVEADINSLYKALRDNKKNTARMIHQHLRKFHKLDAKSIRESLKTLGLSKVVEVTQDTAKREGEKNGRVQNT